jgi:hypothetical protein
MRIRGLLKEGTDHELAQEMKLLRLRQMSSRRRRQVQHDDEDVEVKLQEADSPEDWEADLIEVSVPKQPDILPTSAEASIGKAPVREVQTEEIPQVSQATQTEPNLCRWLTGIDHQSVVRLVRSKPHLSTDQLVNECLIRFPSLVTDINVLKFAILGISWGLECQTRFVLSTAARAMEDPKAGSAIMNGLRADLIEQSQRRY